MGLAQSERNALDAASAPMEAVTKEAVLDADNFNATFKIPDLTTVLSDGRVETFQISSRNVTPDLSFFTVPAVDSRAFIQGQVVNEKDAPLLPGKVLIYRDRSYLGTAHIDFVAANDSFDLSFGADDKIKIIRNPVTIKETEPYWYNQSKSVARLISTIIENLHDFPIKINLLDALPVSENNSISVEQFPDTVVAQQKPVADKRGVVSWVYNYEPNERREIRFGYRIKWPAERDVIVEQIHQSK